MHDAPSSELSTLIFAAHGGNLAAARRLFPAAPEPWLDLSTGISPCPFPFAALPRDAFTRLPDAQSIALLEQSAAQFYGACDSACVVAAPGSQAIIQWLPHLFGLRHMLGARKVALLGPTYSEYADVFGASGAVVEVHTELAALAAADVAIIVNPNNPDGRQIPVDKLIGLAARLAEREGTLIVDEAFADFLPKSASLVQVLPRANVVVLRSFGKSFGLAGLRLGFAIAPVPLADALRSSLGPWAVSGAAIEIARSAFAARAWFSETGRRLAENAAALDRLLEAAGFIILGGTCLFRLAQHSGAAKIFKTLAEAGILVRPFADRSDRLRFGIVVNDGDRARLAAALKVNDPP